MQWFLLFCRLFFVVCLFVVSFNVQKILSLIRSHLFVGFYVKDCSAYVFANNKRSEKEIKKTLSFSKASKIIKYLGINLPKEAKDLYSENYKILMKEIKVDTKERETIFLDWRNLYCQNNYTTLAKLQIQCSPYQITIGIFHRIRTTTEKF